MNNSRKDSMYISNAVKTKKGSYIFYYKENIAGYKVLNQPPSLSPHPLSLLQSHAGCGTCYGVQAAPSHLPAWPCNCWNKGMGHQTRSEFFICWKKYFIVSMKLAIFYHCCRELGVLEENLFSDFRVCFSSRMALDKDSSPLPTSVCLHCIMTYIHTNGSPSV